MIRKIVLTVVAACLTASFAVAKKYKEDFEKDVKVWEIDGEAKVTADQAHSGKKSMLVPQKSNASWTLEKDNKFGTATFWVYDTKAEKPKSGIDKFGPAFGIRNADEDIFRLGFCNWQDLSVKWGTYYWCSTPSNDHSWFYISGDFSSSKIEKGWHKFMFNRPDAKTMEVTRDDAATGAFEADKTQFTTGFNSIVLQGTTRGAVEHTEMFCFDDIEVDLK